MHSILPTFPFLRRSAPRLLSRVSPGHASSSRVRRRDLFTNPYSPFFRSRTKQLRLQSTRDLSHPSSPFENPSAQNEGPAPRNGSFPETSSKAVAYWLLGSAASVFGIVVFGGLTRLTESGLSITEWRPVTGSIPPLNQADWDSEFARYRSSPEFVRLNSHMNMDDFKSIYWMEWTHRLWGRVIGVSFLLPGLYFIARRRVSRHMAFKTLGISALIAFQGALGWWMVKSGLKDDLFAPTAHPRVSQYRLAAHLGVAFVTYVAMLQSGLSILREHRLLADPTASLARLTALRSSPLLRRFRGLTDFVALLVFTTAMSGAFVAGLDAGLIYNEFPWMGVGLAPPRAELFDAWYCRARDGSDLLWRNMLENPSLVQLEHRLLAMTTFSAVVGLFLTPRLFATRLRDVMPRDAWRSLTGVLHLANAQVVMGISTLLYLVPTWLAAMHQAGALALLTGVVLLRSRLGATRRTVALVRQAVEREKGKTMVQSTGRAHIATSLEPKRM